ncbi:hypothetical protein [Herpetosiphon sp. NSE202]|uniref:hypothetical protein n=1 Tax=Herpetosiphon sp. NSE202 TaxID=3351349 RepID=UPI00362A0363
MHCPRCQQNVALNVNRCPNCQQALKPLLFSQQIPLSSPQRQSLINKILLPSAGLLFVAIVLASLSLAVRPVPIWTWLGVAVMVAFTSLYLSRLVGDLRSGYVQVQLDQLTLLGEYSNRSGKHYYAEFSAIGTQQLQKAQYDLAIEGNFYSITYSPNSKIIWELAPLSRSRELA